MIAGHAGTQYVFNGWVIGGMPQTANPASITLVQPYTAIANYTTQYQLVVDSAYGNPQGSGYYDAGTAAPFSVTTPVGFPVQEVFVQWQGDYTGTNPTGSITMDKPHTITAVWSTSYVPLIAIVVVAATVVGALFVLRSRRKRTPPPETKPTPSPVTETPTEVSGAVKCDGCGTENSAGQNFCSNCGKKLTRS
jgi:hypothetical protein